MVFNVNSLSWSWVTSEPSGTRTATISDGRALMSNDITSGSAPDGSCNVPTLASIVAFVSLTSVP